MAKYSICSRSICASRNADSTMPSAADPRPLVSTTSLTEIAEGRHPSTIATLLCGEENSSAKIFIGNAPFIVAQYFHLHPAEGSDEWRVTSDGALATCSKPPFR